MLSNLLFSEKDWAHKVYEFLYNSRGGSRTATTSKMELFVIIVNSRKPLIIITKRSMLGVAAVLNPPRNRFFCILIQCFIIVAHFDLLYCTSACPYAMPCSGSDFFNLDLFFCIISRAKEWTRTFIYSFIIGN